MKLNKEFVAYDTGTEFLLVPAGDASFTGLVKGNRTFGMILELLKTDTAEADIVAAMCGRFDAPEEVIAGDVRKVLTELRRIEAIDM